MEGGKASCTGSCWQRYQHQGLHLSGHRGHHRSVRCAGPRRIHPCRSAIPVALPVAESDPPAAPLMGRLTPGAPPLPHSDLTR